MPDLKQLLADLHTTLAEALLTKVNNSEATAAELSVARQFLKDNGIDTVASVNSPIRKLEEAMPFDDDDLEIEA